MSPIRLFDSRQTIRERARGEYGPDRKAPRARSRRGARPASLLVPQPVHERHRRTSAPLGPARQERNSIAHPRGTFRLESVSGEIRKNAAGARGATGRDLLGRLKNVVVDVEGRAHRPIITHRASDVNRQNRAQAPPSLGVEIGGLISLGFVREGKDRVLCVNRVADLRVLGVSPGDTLVKCAPPALDEWQGKTS